MPGYPTQALCWVVPTSLRCRATSSVEPLLGVGTTFTKVALLESYSCERQSATAEPSSAPYWGGCGCRGSADMFWNMGSQHALGHSTICH